MKECDVLWMRPKEESLFLVCGVAEFLTSGYEADVLRKSTSVSQCTKGDSHMLLKGSRFGRVPTKISDENDVGFWIR